MAKPYVRQSPKPVKQEVFSLAVFGGGLNNVSGDTTIADNQATDCKNMMFVGDEIVEKRYGTVAVDETVLMDGELPTAVTWVDEFKPVNVASSIVRASDKEVYFGTTKASDVSGTVKGTNYIGKYYYVDGDKFMMFNGTKNYQIKEDPKTFATSAYATTLPTPITISVDKLDVRTKIGDTVQHETVAGIKQYVLTGVDIENKTITINTALTQNIASGDLIRLYVPRPKPTYVEGEYKVDETNNLMWYQPCDYELSDSYKGENYIPVHPNTIAIRGERIYLSGDTENPHNIYMSDIANPMYFPAYVGFSCPPNGDIVVDILEFDDALVVARHNDMYVIYGNSPVPTSVSPFQMKKIDTHIGFMARNGYAILNNVLFYLGYDGKFYRMSTTQTNVEYLMTRPLTDIVDIKREPLSFSAYDLQSLSTISYNNEFWMRIGDKIMVYSYSNRGFTYYQGMNASSLYTNGIDVYVGRADGKLAKTDKTKYSDLDLPIDAVYETKRFSLSSDINYKYFNQCMLTSHAFDNYASNISMEFEIDFYYKNNLNVIKSANSAFGITDWGERFIDNNIVKSEWMMLNYRGRTIKFKVSNNALDEPMRIYDINVIYSMRDIR